MAQYSLFVLKVPLNTKQANKQIHETQPKPELTLFNSGTVLDWFHNNETRSKPDLNLIWLIFLLSLNIFSASTLVASSP